MNVHAFVTSNLDKVSTRKRRVCGQLEHCLYGEFTVTHNEQVFQGIRQQFHHENVVPAVSGFNQIEIRLGCFSSLSPHVFEPLFVRILGGSEGAGELLADMRRLSYKAWIWDSGSFFLRGWRNWSGMHLSILPCTRVGGYKVPAKGSAVEIRRCTILAINRHLVLFENEKCVKYPFCTPLQYMVETPLFPRKSDRRRAS